MTQSKLNDLFFIIQLRAKDYSLTQIGSFFALYKDFYLIPGFLFGYWFYYYVYKKIDTFQGTLVLLTLLGIATFLVSFIHHWAILLVANFLFGLVLSQLFYLVFGYAIMWNYRVQGIPITGFFAAALLTGQFVVEIVVAGLQASGSGIFAKFKSLTEILDAPSHQIANWVDLIGKTVMIIFAVAFCLVVVYIIWTLFTFKKIAGDALDLNQSLQKMQNLDREILMQKLNAKLEIAEKEGQ